MKMLISWLIAILVMPVSAFAQSADCDARVLLVGGDTDNYESTNPPPTAELYDPAAETFTRTSGQPSLPPPACAGCGLTTATLLPNGNVLVTANGAAELYRPDHNDFIPTATPLDAMHNAAVGLTNGDVLLFQRTIGAGGVNTAEIYNWTAGTFSPVNSSVIDMIGAASLLNNGDVLLLGDQMTDLYRPGSNDAVGAGAILGEGVSSTVLDDKVLVVELGPDITAPTTQLYSTTSNSFSPAGTGAAMSGPPISYMSATKLDNGDVLFLGGFNNGPGTADILGEAQLYQPSKDAFIQIPQSSIPCDTACDRTDCAQVDCASDRALQQAILLPDGQVLITGGEVAVGFYAGGTLVAPNTAWLYDPAANTFANTANTMTTARVGHAAVLICQPTPSATVTPTSTSAAATPTPTVSATPQSTPTATPLSGAPVISSVPGIILVGSSFNVSGLNFSAGSVVNFFVATSDGPINAGPFVPTGQTPTLLTVSVPASTTLGEGFVSIQVVNRDEGFAASQPASALLQGSAAAGIPTITSINGFPLAATSSDPSFATDNVETVVTQGSLVTLGGTGFDTTNGVAVDLFCSCPGGKVGPFVLHPGSAGLTGNLISFSLPNVGPNDPATGPGSFVVSNAGLSMSFSEKSNAGSVPIGEKITVTSVTQSGSMLIVDGTGFSEATVLNFFNTQSGAVVNPRGLAASRVPKIPLTFVDSSQLTFARPSRALPGASYVQVLNPPFLPFTSSGNSPAGAITLK